MNATLGQTRATMAGSARPPRPAGATSNHGASAAAAGSAVGGALLSVTRAAQLDKPAETGFVIADSPGPIYLPKKVGGIGAQVLSHVATEPRMLIGTAPRFPPSHNADVGPGPGA
jgi:hypothetical protein